MNSRTFATVLLAKQLKGFNYFNHLLISILELNSNPDSQFSVGLIDDNMFNWEICFEGPQSTLYEVSSLIRKSKS